VNEITRKEKSDALLPVTPLHTCVFSDRGQDSVADLAFRNLDVFFLAVGSLAAGSAGRCDLCASQLAAFSRV
jgi:hypothetical protein